MKKIILKCFFILLAAQLLNYQAMAATAASANVSEDDFSKSFRCPESYATEEDRKFELADFLYWYGSSHKTATIKSIAAYRTKLLEAHNCTVTLKNIAENSDQDDSHKVWHDPRFKHTNEYCNTRVGIYVISTRNRDNGLDPKYTFKFISSNQYFKDVPEPEIKSMINVVYFDPDFSNARGPAFENQMMDLCLFGPPKQFEPLK
jgi:hypothetical protein